MVWNQGIKSLSINIVGAILHDLNVNNSNWKLAFERNLHENHIRSKEEVFYEELKRREKIVKLKDNHLYRKALGKHPQFERLSLTRLLND